MSLENTNLSRRKLLKAGAIGVPAAGVLAFGSTLVTATSANAISADGWWGSETSLGLQEFMNTIMTATWSDEDGEVTAIPTVADGVISSQPSSMAPSCPGIVGGWEWLPNKEAGGGSPTIVYMSEWLRHSNGAWIEPQTIKRLQAHYGISQDGRLDGPSQTIMALQNEINQWV
ncbi:peptidoglycan-binding protein [Rothia dentocariosa]|uniref:peptidoglycan-binding protein n=1 Tax=Rothia dentocariosa TaxID=2047 RepID=UPI0028E24842|nr:peptidoglycan-binding protein [Rothia dentocariosa]